MIAACPQCRATPCAACEHVARLDAQARAEMVLDRETAIAEPDVGAQPWELSYEPPAPVALIRLPLVRRAVESLQFEGARVGADDAETAWSLAVAWAAQSVFESSYVRAAWKALALALLAGDEAAALDAAAWIATPGAAMARAVARVQSQGVAA